MDRRTFLKMSWGTVALQVIPVQALTQQFSTAHSDSETECLTSPGTAKYRIDGMAKVLGEKIYARDFRSHDMADWPKSEKIAFILRSIYVDRPVLGINLKPLGQNQPLNVIAADRLQQDDIQDVFIDKSAAERPDGMLVSYGNVAAYYGQPVAILIFKDAESFRHAYRTIQFNPNIIQYDQAIKLPPITKPFAPPTYLTHYEDEQDVLFSQVKNGPSNPYLCQDSTTVDCHAAGWRNMIHHEIENKDWQVFEAERETQLIVPMFMEPESGLAWFDGGTLNLVIGTQSPFGDIKVILSMFNKRSPIKITAVNIVSCYPGGGFGGRDMSLFAPLLSLTAIYCDGPVRIARDRFSEFQATSTQLRSHITQTLAIDKNGIFQAIKTQAILPAGGKNNYSQWVAALAGFSAAGGYKIRRAIVDSVSQPSGSLIAASMRGFGGTQAAFALETLIDEIAVKTNRDPIELRLINALSKGDTTVTGAPLIEEMQIKEILRRAQRNPLWLNRETDKSTYKQQGLYYGVGFALSNQAYGTGRDGVVASVTLLEDGTITVKTNAVDMGNGSATGLSLVTANALGANATTINMGETAVFKHLQLSNKTKTHPKDPWLDPHYTSAFAMSSSACLTAFQQVHAVTNAAQILFQHGVWPSAITLWGHDPGVKAMHSARWQEARLHVEGLPSLALKNIVTQIYKQQGMVETIVHGLFSGRWVSATYDINHHSAQWPIDGLTTRNAGNSNYHWHQRYDILPPPAAAKYYGRSLYAPSATLAAVTINPKTGHIQLVRIHTYLDAGKIIQQDLVSGQYQGAVAMGIGYALLENLPADQSGAGNGSWNLDRYHVAMAKDMPLKDIELELLPALNDTSKGIAEAVLCPIAPAIVNAIYAAINHRFTGIPVSAEMIRKVITT